MEISRILRIAAHALAVTYLTALATLALWAMTPAVLGWHSVLVVGGSMTPVIDRGDIMVSSPIGDLKSLRPGQVLLVDRPGFPGQLLTHRFIRWDAAGDLVTRGDANATEDTDHVAPSAVRGRGRLRIPDLGLPLLWFHEGQPAPLALWAIGTVLAVVLGTNTSVYRPPSPRHRARHRHRLAVALPSVTPTSALSALSR